MIGHRLRALGGHVVVVMVNGDDNVKALHYCTLKIGVSLV